MLTAVKPAADAVDGVGLTRDDDAAAGGEREQRERSGDAVGEAEVGVPAWPAGGGLAARWALAPPAGQGLPVAAQRLGEADEVAQDVVEEVAATVAVQQVGTDAGESAEEVELGRLGKVAAVDAGVRGGEALAGDRGNVVIEPGQGRGVGRLLCDVEGEGDGGGAAVEAGGAGGGR